MIDDLTEDLHLDSFDGIVGETASDRTDPLGEREEWLDGLRQLTALDIHRIGDEFTGQGKPH